MGAFKRIIPATLACLLPLSHARIHQQRTTPKDIAQYRPFLVAMQEPDLCSQANLEDVRESYRFLWLRTFHPPVLVHLRFQQNGQVTLSYKETNGQGGYETGRLVVSNRIDVRELLLRKTGDPEQIELILDGFKQELEQHFWGQPSWIEDDSIRLDGATWTLEGTRKNQCHVVTRWSPPAGSGFRRLSEKLLFQFADRGFDPAEIY
jgi:hypothetical protein